MWLGALLAGALASPPPAPTLWVGEVVRVDLVHRLLVVKTVEPLRETPFVVDAVRTRMASGGRPLALEGVRPGEWARVSYEPGWPHGLALLVRVGVDK